MLQFNLRSLFGLTVAVAVLTWILFVLPGAIGNIVLLAAMVVLTSALVAGIVYFRAYWQAFCIGALPPQVMMFTSLFYGSFLRPPADFEFKLALGIFLTVTLLGGLAAAGVRYLATRPTISEPPAPVRYAKKFPGVPEPGESPFGNSDSAPQPTATVPSTPDP